MGTDSEGSGELVKLFTDGACSGNPGPGGWAFILQHPATGHVRDAAGAEPETTNNRMELMGVIAGLASLTRPCLVELVTDDLWQKVDALLTIHKVRVKHVLGHRGHPENEACDRMAVDAYKKLVEEQRDRRQSRP
jgi:ribonuclease HI